MVKSRWKWFKGGLPLFLNRLWKVEKVAKIDQNGKGLAFTFWPFLGIFSTS